MSGETKITVALPEDEYADVEHLAGKHHTSIKAVMRLGARLAQEANRVDTGEEDDGLFVQRNDKESKIIPGW